MPRNYKRKTETKYSLEDLKKVIVDVQTKKLSIGRAANTCVPKTTIYLSNVSTRLPHLVFGFTRHQLGKKKH